MLGLSVFVETSPFDGLDELRPKLMVLAGLVLAARWVLYMSKDARSD